MDPKLVQAAIKKVRSKKGKPVSFAYAPNGAEPVLSVRTDSKPISPSDFAKAAKAAKIELVGATVAGGTVFIDEKGALHFTIDKATSRGSAVRPDALQRVLRLFLKDELAASKVLVADAKEEEDQPKPPPTKVTVESGEQGESESEEQVVVESRKAPLEQEEVEDQGQDETVAVDENGVPFPPSKAPPKVKAQPVKQQRPNPPHLDVGETLFRTDNHVGITKWDKEGKATTRWGVCAAMSLGWMVQMVPAFTAGEDIKKVAPEANEIKLGLRHAWLKKRDVNEPESMSKRAFERMDIPCEGELRSPIMDWGKVIATEVPRLSGPCTFTIKHPTNGAHMMALVAGPTEWLYMDPNFGVYRFADRPALVTAMTTHMKSVYKKYALPSGEPPKVSYGEYAFYGHTAAPKELSEVAPWDVPHHDEIEREKAEAAVKEPGEWLLRYSSKAGEWVVTAMKRDRKYEHVRVGKQSKDELLSVRPLEKLIKP